MTFGKDPNKPDTSYFFNWYESDKWKWTVDQNGLITQAYHLKN